MTHVARASRHSMSGSKKPAHDGGFVAFRSILYAYVVGKARLPAVRRELIQCVSASHERAVSLLHFLRGLNESGVLTDAAMHILSTDVQVAVFADESGAKPNPVKGHGEIHVTSTHRAMPGQGTVLAGRFEICERVGKGGVGEIFLARDLRRVELDLPDSRVAIKLIQRQHSTCPDAIRSLQREAVNAQCLVHPGIRRVYELDRYRRRFFIVMEWLDGETIDVGIDRLKGKWMAVKAFRVITQQIATALAFANS